MPIGVMSYRRPSSGMPWFRAASASSSFVMGSRAPSPGDRSGFDMGGVYRFV